VATPARTAVRRARAAPPEALAAVLERDDKVVVPPIKKLGTKAE
jgi:hypothetical protein